MFSASGFETLYFLNVYLRLTAEARSLAFISHWFTAVAFLRSEIKF